MKKLILIIVAIIFLSGCAALKVERNVTADNVFYSSFPRFKIKFAPEFLYIEGIGKTTSQESISGEVTLHGSSKWYLFVEAEDRVVKRGVGVHFQNTSGRYITDFDRNIKDTADKGKCQLNGKEYRYYTKVLYRKGSALEGHINKKGFTISCGLFRMSGRIMGVDSKNIVSVVYFEALKGSGTKCKSWIHKEALTLKHLAYLDDFNKRFMASFEILEP